MDPVTADVLRSCFVEHGVVHLERPDGRYSAVEAAIRIGLGWAPR